eukprot:Selendium_serpulae@DN3262_c0_g1_i1.p1
MPAEITAETQAEFLAQLRKDADAVKATKPDNRCTRYLGDYLGTLTGPAALPVEEAKMLYKCVRTGVDNPDSEVGCYAMRPADYTTFSGFFDKVVRDYHGDESGKKVHKTDWTVPASSLDLSTVLKNPLSMRVRVGRNLKGFNLPGASDRAERIRFEKTMLQAFRKLIADPTFGGKVFSLTPDFGDNEKNPNLITDEQYQQLIDDHIMFKPMDKDPYLLSAGIAGDWPYGRGCWQSADKQCMVWFGEEDMLRVMVMRKSKNLRDIFEKLKELLDRLESIEGVAFAAHSDYGFVTSCPSNLGTGMRASVHLQLPSLTKGGATLDGVKAVCSPMGLSVRGLGGEHTAAGKDGTVDISPRARLFISEREIVEKLSNSVRELIKLEGQ